MADIPETYELHSLEQMRTIADPLRLRIIEQLTRQAMTVTQLAELFGEVPSRLHYHVRELERVGLLKLVETREKGGILEKYYRAVAKTINAPGTLLRGVPPDEAIATFHEIIQPFIQEASQAARHIIHIQAWDDPDQVVQLMPEHCWMTVEEFSQVRKQIEGLLKPYKERRGIDQERQRSFLIIAYTTPPAAGPEAGPGDTPPAEPAPSKPPKREVMLTAGVTHYNRKDLEKHLAAGERLEIYVLGTCIFADDVTADLADRAIGSFHIWGRLNASPEVREVLKRKGGESKHYFSQ